MNIDKDYIEFAKKNLEGFREKLRQSVSFECACCRKQKSRGEAAGAHTFKPEDPTLWKAMEIAPGRHRVAAYAVCLECKDEFAEDIILKKVISYLGSQGLFGEGPKA